MHFLVNFIVILLICVVSSERRPVERNAIDQLEKNINEIQYRLPNNTKPLNYDITLITNIDKNEFNFTGVAVISVHVLEISSKITLHAGELTIKSVKLATTSGTMIKLNPFTYDVTTEFLTIPSQNQLDKNSTYLLIIDYSGDLRTDQFGFYRSSYVNSKGEKKQVFCANKEFHKSVFMEKYHIIN